MFLEEIKAYNSLITKTDDIKEVFSIIDKIDSVFDLKLIAESLLNDISILEKIDSSSEEIKWLNVKVRCIMERINELDDRTEEKSDLINFVFATSKAGNTYVFDDIESIDKSYYPEIIGCFDNIKKGAELKSFSSNDRRKNVLSYKMGHGRQVRVYMMKILDNYLCVFGVAVKKDNWSKKMSQMINSRIAIVSDEAHEFKKMIEAEDESFIEKNKKNYSDIQEVLTKNEKNPYFEACKNYLISYSNNYTTRMISEDKLYDLLDELDLRELCEISKLVSDFEIPDFIKNIIQDKIKDSYLNGYGVSIDSKVKMISKKG